MRGSWIRTQIIIAGLSLPIRSSSPQHLAAGFSCMVIHAGLHLGGPLLNKRSVLTEVNQSSMLLPAEQGKEGDGNFPPWKSYHCFC